MSVRQGIKGHSAQVFIFVVFVAYVSGMYLALRPARPKFKVGDCIQLNREREEWDTTPDTVRKIARIGKKHYLMADGFDTSFSFQNIYKQVPCK